MKFLLPAGILATVGLTAALASWGDGRTRVTVVQPVAFSHKKHMDYFTSGKHREEKIRMHLESLEIEKPPKPLVEGRCVKCHEDLETKTACASCHLPSQDAALRGRGEQRPCIACHGGTWSGSQAGIPSATLCRSCHGGDPRTNSDEEKKLREYLSSGRDIPWMQLHTVPDDVHFSHVAHVRFGAMGCTTCHEDMRGKEEPPTSATVFTMDACMKCHREKHATSDCIACHE